MHISLLGAVLCLSLGLFCISSVVVCVSRRKIGKILPKLGILILLKLLFLQSTRVVVRYNFVNVAALTSHKTKII